MGQVFQRPPDVKKREYHRKKVELVLSNAVAIGVCVYEIARLDVCFDGDELGVGSGSEYDYDENSYDDDYYHNGYEDYDEIEAAFTKDFFMSALVCGLLLEIVPLLVLSPMHKTLVDTRSAHVLEDRKVNTTLPSPQAVDENESERSGLSKFIGNVFVPCGTSLIGVLMGVVTLEYGFKKSCDGNGDETSATILLVAGPLSILAGVILLLFFLGCSPRVCCCTKTRGDTQESDCKTCGGCVKGCMEVGHKCVWVTGTVWKLVGVIVSYRAGTYNHYIAWLVGLLTATAEWRATLAGVIVVGCDLNLINVL